MDPGAAGWQTEPEFILEHRLLASGEPPLWNPYNGFGEPLAAVMLSQPYYPLAWLVEAVPSVRTYDWFVALRLWCGMLFAFLYLRYYAGVWPAVAGAFAYGLTGYFMLYYDMPHLSVEVLLPALLFAVERLVRRRDWSAAGFGALVLAAVVLGGMPESAFLAFAFAGAYAIVRVVADASARKRARAIAVLGAVGVVVGALITSVLTLPFLEFAGVALTQHPAGSTMGTGADPWAVQDVATYVAPLMYGPPWNDIFTGWNGWSGVRGYWGAAATFFALTAIGSYVVERLRGARGWSPEPFFAGAAAVLIAKRFGVPLVNELGALPGFARIGLTKYDEALLGLCVAALAAFGIDRLVRGRAPRPAAALAAFVLLVVLTCASVVAIPAFYAAGEHRMFFANAVAWALLVLAGAFALAWWSARVNATALLAGAVALVMADVALCYVVPMWYVVDEPPPASLYAANGAPYVAFMQHETARTHERVLGTDYLLYPEWSSVFGICDVRDLNGLYARDYLPFVRTFFPDEQAPQDMHDRFTGMGITHLGDPLARRFLVLELGAVRRIPPRLRPRVRQP